MTRNTSGSLPIRINSRAASSSGVRDADRSIRSPEIHAVVTATTERDDGGDEGSRAHVSLQGLRRSRVVVRDTSPDIAAYREKRSAGPDAGRPRVLGARHCRSAAPLARPRASSEGKVDPAGEAG